MTSSIHIHTHIYIHSLFLFLSFSFSFSLSRWTEWANKMGFTDMIQVMRYFQERLWDIIETHGVSIVAWEEIFTDYGLTSFPDGRLPPIHPLCCCQKIFIFRCFLFLIILPCVAIPSLFLPLPPSCRPRRACLEG